jgi:hypothetical protein
MSQVIAEGGNIFRTKEGQPATQRIDQAAVLPTVRWLEKITGLPLVDNMLGSTGRAPTSGDLDLAVDPSQHSKQQLAQKLESWAQAQGLDPREYVRKSGISVHFRAPIMGQDDQGHVQVDFMFGDPEWMKFSMAGGQPNSPFKGLHRHLLLSSIAKSLGLKWSHSQGLISRATDQVISRDPDQIAEYLLGPGSTRQHMATVESIVDRIRRSPDYSSMVAQAREDFAREGLRLPEPVTESDSHWFRRITDSLLRP